MKVGISLPIRELRDDLGAVKAFAQMADDFCACVPLAVGWTPTDTWQSPAGRLRKRRR